MYIGADACTRPQLSNPLTMVPAMATAAVAVSFTVISAGTVNFAVKITVAVAATVTLIVTVVSSSSSSNPCKHGRGAQGSSMQPSQARQVLSLCVCMCADHLLLRLL